jgi:hypothetical protein
LDIEGSELSFLEGARKTLQKIKPIVLMEINPSSFNASKIKEKDLLQFLKNLGFRKYRTLNESDKLYNIDLLAINNFQNVLLYSY